MVTVWFSSVVAGIRNLWMVTAESKEAAIAQGVNR